jgi:perosamine synthetase
MTTGEGGMVFARDSAIEKKIRILKNQGLSQSGNYIHEVLGYNYRMTNLQAAIGCAQVERLETILGKKNQNHNLYTNYLKNSSTIRLLEPIRGVSSYWMETVILEDSKQRDKVRHALESKGIETRPGFTDMTNLSFYAQSKKSSVGIYGLGESVINLPSGSKLTERQIELVTEALKESLANL